ncbi:MAG: hypothetical protein HOC71_01805, partial [Candidatus Latescibacteria bacterium]|nr:hypothetical protein [Candidatus Latescibacterota bacterium]
RPLGTDLTYYLEAYASGLTFRLPSNQKEYYTLQVAAHKPGDVGGDGKVDISDVLDLLDVLVSSSGTPQSDVDGDGKTNIKDILKLLIILRSN